MRDQPDPPDWPALPPPWIVVSRSRGSPAVQYALQISHCIDGGKSCFAEIHLVTIFQCAKQFDAVERAEIQIAFQIGLRGQFGLKAMFNSRDEFPQGTGNR